MKTSELRLGNFVGRGWVTHIDFDRIDITTDSGWSEFVGDEIEQINPILLAEERLLRFGFIGERGFYHKLTNKYEYFMHIPGELGDDYILTVSGLEDNEADRQININECRFVHRLQNIYYALEEEDLYENK